MISWTAATIAFSAVAALPAAVARRICRWALLSTSTSVAAGGCFSNSSGSGWAYMQMSLELSAHPTWEPKAPETNAQPQCFSPLQCCSVTIQPTRWHAFAANSVPASPPPHTGEDRDSQRSPPNTLPRSVFTPKYSECAERAPQIRYLGIGVGFAHWGRASPISDATVLLLGIWRCFQWGFYLWEGACDFLFQPLWDFYPDIEICLFLFAAFLERGWVAWLRWSAMSRPCPQPTPSAADQAADQPYQQMTITDPAQSIIATKMDYIHHFVVEFFSSSKPSCICWTMISRDTSLTWDWRQSLY